MDAPIFPLSDGAFLVVTGATVRDRLGRDYSGPIAPDEPVGEAAAEAAAKASLGRECR